MINGEIRSRVIQAVRDLPRTRFLITGGEGMLGQAFARLLRRHSPHAEVRVLGKDKLDVTREEQVRSYLNWIEDGWIIHCAALVSVEGCARNPALARATIVDGTRNISRLAEDAVARIFYPQSFLIYDGQVNPIAEDDDPRPLSLYGQLKVEAEKIVLDSHADFLVVRMAGFFGGESRDKNFVGQLIPNLANLIRVGEASYSVGDRVWQPTWTEDLALNSLGLIAHRKSGIYQMACHGEASFYELTRAIVEELGWERCIEIKKVPLEQVAKHELGNRPSKAVLSCTRIREESLDIHRPWREALREYLSSQYFEQFRRVRRVGTAVS